MNRFNKLIISDWQQFKDLDIDFHDRLTIITGANGSGKTTILNLLGRHCGWDMQTLAVPKKDKVTGIFDWIVGRVKRDTNNQVSKIGTITYTDTDSITELSLPNETSSASYAVNMHNQQSVGGFFIPSHRSVYRYQPLNNIPTNIDGLTKNTAFNRVSQSNRERYFGGGNNQSANYHMKEILVAWSTFGYGNETMDSHTTLIEYYKGFEEILSKILPSNLGFTKLAIRNFEVVLDCDSGEFLIDAASGGVTALIDIAWQIYMFHEDKQKAFTVIIDEIENHLHPSMQRRLLNDLLDAFPNVTFIVSTHSPLIVNSVRDSNVYALRYNDNRVTSMKLDLVNQAKTAGEILDEVLGVSFTMPIWVEDKLKEIVSQVSTKDMTPQTLADVREKLSSLGLEELMPQAIERIVEGNNDQN